MNQMKDNNKVEATGDADAVNSELSVENTIENLIHTVEDNHISLVSENVEKVNLETDMLDDCKQESRIEITKDVENQNNQNNVELLLECQEVADNNMDLNCENTSGEMFHCNIAQHERLRNEVTLHSCKFCSKKFKLKFYLNRHLENNHVLEYKCDLCRAYVVKSKLNEHKKIHENEPRRLRYQPIDCRYCDAYFQHRFTLIRHINKMHRPRRFRRY